MVSELLHRRGGPSAAERRGRRIGAPGIASESDWDFVGLILDHPLVDGFLVVIGVDAGDPIVFLLLLVLLDETVMTCIYQSKVFIGNLFLCCSTNGYDKING
jgi:hypothetical protein